MRDHAQIITAAGKPETLAEKLGVSVHTVRSWVQRNSLPADHWQAFVDDGAASWEELWSARPKRAEAA